MLLSTGLSSCQDWLKEETYDFTQPDDIEDSDAGATQWLIGCYSRLSTLFNGNTFPMVWLYDEDYLTGPSWAFGTLGAGNFQNNGNVNSMWTGLYELIHRCNYSTYMVNQMGNVDPRLKTAILGEMKFLKAWSYFQLVRAFGPIPVRKESISETGERNVPRSSVEDVYGYIIELLDDAKVECYKNTDKEYMAGRVTAGTAAVSKPRSTPRWPRRHAARHAALGARRQAMERRRLGESLHRSPEAHLCEAPARRLRSLRPDGVLHTGLRNRRQGDDRRIRHL